MRILTIAFDGSRDGLFETLRRIRKEVRHGAVMWVVCALLVAAVTTTLLGGPIENTTARATSYLEQKAEEAILRRVPEPKKQPVLPVPVPNELRRLIEILRRTAADP